MVVLLTDGPLVVSSVKARDARVDLVFPFAHRQVGDLVEKRLILRAFEQEHIARLGA